MADPHATLQNIVALRRQKAEQHYQSLQRDMNDLQATIRILSAKLAAIDGSGIPDRLRILAHQRGHIEMLIAGIKEQSHLISEKRIELNFARDGLKWAMYSQSQV